MKLIKLPNGDYINPDQVVRLSVATSKETQKTSTTIHTTERTWFLGFDGDVRDELAALLSHEPNVEVARTEGEKRS